MKYTILTLLYISGLIYIFTAGEIALGIAVLLITMPIITETEAIMKILDKIHKKEEDF